MVPTLVHDGVPIINSFCINEYIEDAFPEPSLRPADLVERARMRYWAWTADEIHLSLARLTHAHMLQAQVRELSAADRKIMLAHTPVPEKRERWRLLAKGGYSAEQLQTALDNVLFMFGRMEEELASAGRGSPAPPSRSATSTCSPSCTASSSFIRIASIARFPALNDWWDRVMARPAAKYVYTNGTEETPKRPATKSIAGITEYRV